jgi:hypothetical protein
MVGDNAYSQTFDTSSFAVNTWTRCTLIQTVGVGGPLSLCFKNLSGRAGWLDKVSNVSVTRAAPSVTYASWASANGVIGAANADANQDGVPNGIAYFVGETGRITLPRIDGHRLTWDNGGNIPSSAYGSQFFVETSSDLVTWTEVDASDLKSNTDKLVYEIPSAKGERKTFVRLKVIVD